MSDASCDSPHETRQPINCLVLTCKNELLFRRKVPSPPHWAVESWNWNLDKSNQLLQKALAPFQRCTVPVPVRPDWSIIKTRVTFGGQLHVLSFAHSISGFKFNFRLHTVIAALNKLFKNNSRYEIPIVVSVPRDRDRASLHHSIEPVAPENRPEHV